MSKYDEIYAMAIEVRKEVVKNADNWKRYLTTAARLYKYPFEEQILIYAQKPEATACASMEIWNKKMNCWVNRGTKGIALLDMDSKHPQLKKLKYVFDVSDVHKARNIGRDPQLWELKEEHKEIVLARLEKTYGETKETGTFEERLLELAERISQNCYEELLPDLIYAKEGSFLEDLDDLNLAVRLRETLTASISYTLLSRCGADMEEWEKEINFDYIHEFNNRKSLYIVGNTTTEVCKPLLMEIGRTIAAYEKQKTLANSIEWEYNALKRESETVNKDNKETEGVAYGTDIPLGRRLSDTKSDSTPGSGGSIDEVRDAAGNISEGASFGDLQGNADGGRFESTSPAGTGTGRGDDGVSDSADGENRRRERGAEGSRPDEMGGEDEQYPAFSGGSRTARSDLHSVENDNFTQLSLFPSVEEQVETIEKAAEVTPVAFSVPENSPELDTHAANFTITDEGLGIGSAKEKFHRNVEAIRTLELIEGENRIATPEEQKILSQYVGWGGLPDAFDETKANWAEEYKELKGLLSPEEYASARESTLNAHYTSPVIIRSMYDTLDRMGFEKGNLLEPAMGTGNFFGMLPEKMGESRLYGVELDSITGRIAKQLYPNADIQVKGFEKTDYPNDFFDVAIGNVPFGQYKVADRQYDKHNFLIHDYFFAKTLDKVRPGGVVAFVTSKGTMDKKNPEVRKYLAQRAELLGAVRLPNTAFKANAGTEVTSDILFFQKRDRLLDIEPAWVQLAEDKNGIEMNAYFASHPEQIVGQMEMVTGPYGMESTCQPIDGIPFEKQLETALANITGHMENIEREDVAEQELSGGIIPAEPTVKNFSYTVVGDEVYYRENSIMKPVDVPDTTKERIKGMVAIRNCTHALIDVQLNEFSDDVIKEKQAELNELYDTFSEKYGRITSPANKRAFNQDGSYCLLCSLEETDDEGNFKEKAAIFTKRTIKKAEVITSVDTATEALAVSLAEKAGVDLAYMAGLTGKSTDAIKEELIGVIFENPATGRWETADEYLSGNVRDKLERAKAYAAQYPEYEVNVQALTQIQPKELEASEIEVRIGATWIDAKYIEDFMRDTFETPAYLFHRNTIGVQYSDVTGQWNVKGKNADYNNFLVNLTYGTSRRNAYTILEDSLNLKDSRVYDTVVEDGKEKRVLNKKETAIAGRKQETIEAAFKDWVFRDPERRQILTEKYNWLFNSTRPREYDGSHLKFPGMTPDIELKPHQKNAVAHVLYGNNTLLAHCVGAGKTFEMTAAAMESKRLGLCHKSLFVVPNHLTEQWSKDFLRLYPGANILAATKKDFEPANRKKFCSRIATGDYDAVIIGHSQFEKIPLSQERQTAMMERQIADIQVAIAQAKADNGERYAIKQMEKSRKALMTKLEKLNDRSRKDDVVTFEQLGIDRLFVDESHNYKNLFLYTKMRNVAGIAQTEAQKSSDMFAKCQYLDELTGGQGVTFATGTPISNSMTELYTNMRYLQYDTLQRLGLGHFDSWASSFGEILTDVELAPEGTGYRAKTRFARFFNLPELLALFKESADIQTPDMLKLPIPEAEYENVVLKPSDYQKEMIQSLAKRAKAVRDRLVEPYQDNMLKITNDGRKLALDQRLINDLLPDNENSKASVCVEKAFEIWEQTKEQRSTQLIFCDLSTPKGDGTFNVYDDIRNKLIEKGVPEEEIAFIHNANTEARKTELFNKVKSGQVRFLLGSTQKMGAGTNVQDRLIALHHLDVPWRPSDIEQQEGRILRQGNQNPKVKIFRYVTEGTFDSYSWQLIENKQKFIGQIMTSKSPVRSCEDIDEAALTYAEVKALATGNPYIKEKMDLDIQVAKLKLMKANHTSQQYRLEDNITKHYPQQIAALKEQIEGLRADIQTVKASLQQTDPSTADKEPFSMKVGDMLYTDKKEAGAAIIGMCTDMKSGNSPMVVGEYAGLKMVASFDKFNQKFVMNVKGKLSHNVEIGSNAIGNISRINHALKAMPEQLEAAKIKLETVEHQLETAKTEVAKPFTQETELAEKLDRLSTLNALLNMDEEESDVIDMDKDTNKDMNKTSQESSVIADFKAKTEELFHNISELNPAEIEETVKVHVQAKLAELGIEAAIVEVAVTGSRCRGLEKEESDLDVVVELSTNEREDYLFDVLNESALYIGDVKVDINPITAQNTGTLETYLPQVEDYLKNLAEYKPLAKVEELEEQNYNMIDNVLNNGAEKTQREETKKKQEQPAARPKEKPSLRARLSEKQAQINKQKQGHNGLENEKKNPEL
jgi:N12 class adenine-specific DNA methylase/predicted nucleotidyltransferase